MSWSFAGTVADRLIGFVVGIILARLLTPKGIWIGWYRGRFHRPYRTLY
ncbi:MAG: hypothetical protein AB2L20_05230 [Mangrovibacterium sp.]